LSISNSTFRGNTISTGDGRGIFRHLLLHLSPAWMWFRHSSATWRIFSNQWLGIYPLVD
jgi:hypothetical protein